MSKANRNFFLTVVMFAALITACGTEQTGNIDVRGEGFTKFEVSNKLVFPTEGHPSNTDGRKIPKKEYRLTEILVYAKSEKLKAQAFFHRKLKDKGAFKDEDTQVVQGEFTCIPETDGKPVSLMVSLSIPMGLNADGNQVDFQDRRFYSVSVSSDNTFRVRASGKESPAGIRFYELFDDKGEVRRAIPVYRKGLLSSHEKQRPDQQMKVATKGTAQIIGEEVVYVVDLKQPDNTAYVLHVRYRPK